MIIPDPSNQSPPPFDPRPHVDQEERFDWADRLSLDMVRQHTKTDDTPGVTDDMLSLYREAAIEAAELYTGMLLSGKKTVTEAIHVSENSWRSHYRHRM